MSQYQHFSVKLTAHLQGRELHTGDNILPNTTIILLFRSRGGTRAHGQFQCLDVLASVLQTLPLHTIYEQTLRTYRQVSTNWHLQVHVSNQQCQWGREFTTKANNPAAHIEVQHCRHKLPQEVEDSENTVLELMLCFPADQQTCMAGINYLWSAIAHTVKVITVHFHSVKGRRPALSLQ